MPTASAELHNNHSDLVPSGHRGSLEPPPGREQYWAHGSMSRHRVAQMSHYPWMQSDTGSLGASFATERWLGPSPALGATALPIPGPSAALSGGLSWSAGSFQSSMPSHRSVHAPLVHLNSGISTASATVPMTTMAPSAFHSQQQQPHGQKQGSGAASALARAGGSLGRISSGGTASLQSDSCGRVQRRLSVRGSGHLHRICSCDLATGISDSPQTVSGGRGGNDWDPFFPELADEISGPVCSAAVGVVDTQSCGEFAGSAFVPVDAPCPRGGGEPLQTVLAWEGERSRSRGQSFTGQGGEFRVLEVVKEQPMLSWSSDVVPQ
jgi:hypothetical protein